MIDFIFSTIALIIGFFWAGLDRVKKSINQEIEKQKLNEIEKIHEDSIKRSNDDRINRIDRLSKDAKD